MSLKNELARLSRRNFLIASAAAFTSLHSLSVFGQVEGQRVDPAAPRGRQRNLLVKSCTTEKLAASLIPAASYRPFPTLSDRKEWEALSPATRASLLAAGEKHLGFKWPEMPATVFLEYARNGNRTDYEHIRSARMAALQDLTFAECVEAKGRFIDDIINGIWATCEESFWGVPAHLYIQKADLGLPDPRDPIVDLFAAQTSALVATVVYLLGPALDKVSPLIRDRVYVECERRIFDPLLKQNFMWMGLPGGKSRHDLPWIEVPEGVVQPVNNWDAWICWNWLTTVLFVDRDDARRSKSVQKIFVCLDKFINSYPDDGGCEEGPSYWNVAAGAMFDALELLHSSTKGAVDIYREPLITEMALYMNRVHIAGNYYLNPGDAPPIIHLDVDKMFRFGTRLKNPDLLALAVSSLRSDYVPSTLPAIFNERNLRQHPAAKARLLRDTWLPDSCVMAARRQAESTDGLYLACIAADNGKSHSHNDTGTFWVYSNGFPIFIDLGQETYQKKSFDAHRYEIPSTQSSFHNLPSIGDVQQGVGPQFRATDLVYHADDRSAELKMELSRAYSQASQLKSWQRSVRLNREKNTIDIEDNYLLAKEVSGITLNLMTACEVVQSSRGELTLLSKQGAPPTLLTFDASILTSSVETVNLANEELEANWGSIVHRIQLKASGQNTSGRLKIDISSRTKML
ncbi:MAG: heparinase II/III-family protein [Acidobacteriota bacterium]|nr:heparinase II/III-family protein [Acidobacteriota bacterium]